MIDSHPETSRRQTILKKTEHFVGVFAISPAVEAILFLAILPQYLGPLTNPDLYNNQMLGAYLVALTTGVGIDALASARTGEKFRPLLSVGKALGLALLTSYAHYNPEAIKSWGQAFDKLIHPPQTPTPPATPTFTPSPSPMPTETIIPSLTPTLPPPTLTSSPIPPTMTSIPPTFTPNIPTTIPAMTATLSPEQIAEAEKIAQEQASTNYIILGILAGITLITIGLWKGQHLVINLGKKASGLPKASRQFFNFRESSQNQNQEIIRARLQEAEKQLANLAKQLRSGPIDTSEAIDILRRIETLNEILKQAENTLIEQVANDR